MKTFPGNLEHKSLSSLLCIAGMLLAWPAKDTGAGEYRKSRHAIPGSYIVLLRGQAGDMSGSAARLERLLAAYRAQARQRWHHAVNGFAARMTPEEALALAQDPEVAIVEEDSLVTAYDTQTEAPWGLDRIDQREPPLDASYHYANAGEGVTVYVVDTGIRSTHREFGGRVTAGHTTVNDGNGTEDCSGHGTHVAGIIGGAYFGVAKNVLLTPVRVLDCHGKGSTTDFINGVNWLTGQVRQAGKPAVANLSLGLDGTSEALDTAIQNAIGKGVVVVVAAGNRTDTENPNACKYSPARVSAAITVGAIAFGDIRPGFSYFGPCLDLFAPGDYIPSAWFSSDTGTNILSGTSMAAPHVSGAAALLLAANRKASPADVTSALLADATPGKIIDPGAGSPNRLLYTGFIPPIPADTTPPKVTLTSPAPGSRLTGRVTLSAEAADDSEGSGIALVEFWVDDRNIGVDTEAPFAMTWDSATVSDDAHLFQVRAADRAGNTAQTTAISATTLNHALPPPCSAATQLLGNAGFESGPGVNWKGTAGLIGNRTPEQAHRGSWLATLNGKGRVNAQKLHQRVTIPADSCSVLLRFWLRIDTAEPASAPARDTLKVTVNKTSGSVWRTLATYSNRDATAEYVVHEFDLTRFRGKTVRIQFSGSENQSRATGFRVDDTELEIRQ